MELFKYLGKTNVIVSALLGILLLIATFFHLIMPSFTLSFLAMILAYNIVNYLKQKSKQSARPDERIKQIAKTSMSLAFQFSMYSAVLLYGLLYFKIVQLESSTALLLIIAIMYLSFLVPAIILRKFGSNRE